MNEKQKFQTNLKIFLFILTIFLFTVIICCNLIMQTNTRYIKKETDEIRGYYTSLYFQGTGEGNCIVLENNVGFTTFELMNYIGEDVTKRNIEYNIRTLETYYDKNGNVIIPNDEVNQDLYVKDVWGNPKPIANNTYKYKYEVIENTGETGSGGTSGGDYQFTYQQDGTKDIGKKHSVTLKVIRDSELTEKMEQISIVVDLIKPYKEVYIINMIIVNRLIAFTQTDHSMFNIDFKSLNIQTADIFTRNISINDNIYAISSKAFKVTLIWENLIFDERNLSIIHNVVSLEEIINKLNGNPDSSNIDISKSYLINLSYESSSSGRLELYIPQSANINFDFLPTNDIYNVYAKVEIFSNNNYVLYDDNYGGYSETERNNIDLIYVLGNNENELIH